MPDVEPVLLQPIPSWSSGSIIGSHLGTADYLLSPRSRELPAEASFTFSSNEAIWKATIQDEVSVDDKIRLEGFHFLEWFPRAPGLYHTPNALYAREEAYSHLDLRFPQSPIRDHARVNAEPALAGGHTVVFTPEGKMSMLEGGIGSIRLDTAKIDDKNHWFMTATSDGVAHAGFPLAVPLPQANEVITKLHRGNRSAYGTVWGTLERVDDRISPLFDPCVMVPRVYLKVAGFNFQEPPHCSLETSAAVSFVSEFQGYPNVYATYVTFQPGNASSFQDSIRWMKAEYVEGAYSGKIITDFDQTRTVFPEAKLALKSVMGGAISRGILRETLELMHLTASADQYLDEIARRNLLRNSQNAARSKIFISYSHSAEKNTGWMKRIQTHLQTLAHSSQFELWDDTRLDPGQRWREEIERAIRQTKVAVLLLTADFLASEFIRDSELPLLLEAADTEGATILCVYGSHIHLTGPAERLLRFQSVNPPSEPLQALSDSGREVVYAQLVKAVQNAVRSD